MHFSKCNSLLLEYSMCHNTVLMQTCAVAVVVCTKCCLVWWFCFFLSFISACLHLWSYVAPWSWRHIVLFHCLLCVIGWYDKNKPKWLEYFWVLEYNWSAGMKRDTHTCWSITLLFVSLIFLSLFCTFVYRRYFYFFLLSFLHWTC